MPGFEDIPVLLVNRFARDRHTQEVLAESYYFIESLFHEGIIVHIAAIGSQRRRDELETLLSIFDQGGIETQTPNRPMSRICCGFARYVGHYIKQPNRSIFYMILSPGFLVKTGHITIITLLLMSDKYSLDMGT